MARTDFDPFVVLIAILISSIENKESNVGLGFFVLSPSNKEWW